MPREAGSYRTLGPLFLINSCARKIEIDALENIPSHGFYKRTYKGGVHTICFRKTWAEDRRKKTEDDPDRVHHKDRLFALTNGVKPTSYHVDA